MSAVLYTKEDCSLCDRAKAVLRRLQTDFELDVREVDITRDPSTYEEYRYAIPVLVIDGRHRFEANRITEHYVRRVLEGRRRRWPWERW